MPMDNRNLVQVLKMELNYLSEVGYGQAEKTPVRVPLVFEDTPSCLNCDNQGAPSPCGECVLIQLVPPESRTEKVPCRHIPITSDGESLMDLYGHSSHAELEILLGRWLREVISELEGAAPDTKPNAEPDREIVRQEVSTKSADEQLVN